MNHGPPEEGWCDTGSRLRCGPGSLGRPPLSIGDPGAQVGCLHQEPWAPPHSYQRAPVALPSTATRLQDGKVEIVLPLYR